MEVIKRILGVDPGTNVLGYALIETDKKGFKLVQHGVVYMEHLPDTHQKLKRIHERLTEIIRLYEPTEMSIEAPFFGKNIQTMLKLGRAQGVAIATALAKDLPVTEYAVRKIKQSVTGKGNASKEQVAAMLEYQLGIKLEKDYLDATDALAIAVCHYYQNRHGSVGQKSHNSWASFLKDNPDRKL